MNIVNESLERSVSTEYYSEWNLPWFGRDIDSPGSLSLIWMKFAVGWPLELTLLTKSCREQIHSHFFIKNFSVFNMITVLILEERLQFWIRHQLENYHQSNHQQLFRPGFFLNICMMNRLLEYFAFDPDLVLWVSN